MYAILTEEILFEEINFHPVFSYALDFYRKKYPDLIVYVDEKLNVNLVKEYHNNVKKTSPDIDEIGDKIELHNPLVAENFTDHKVANFKIEDNFSLLAAKSLICSDLCKNRPEKINKHFEIKRVPNPEKPKLIVTAPYDFFIKSLKETIESNYDVIYCYQAPKEIVKELIADREIIFTSTCPPYLVDEDLLENASNLSIVATPSTGTTHLDNDYLAKSEKHVITIKTSPVIEQIFASSEFSFTLLIAMINKLPEVVEAAKYGNWRENEAIFRSNELMGKTIGLLGYGRIGKKMAKYSSAFGMRVLAYDPYVEIEDEYVEEVSSKEEILGKSDIVSLHYHLTPETNKSFTANDFSKMKKGAFFLNTARGELVDEEAMLHHLKSGHLKAAAVDVITDEYLPDKWNHPVIKYSREHKNLLVSPHVAGLTIESESKSAADIFKQLEQYLNER